MPTAGKFTVAVQKCRWRSNKKWFAYYFHIICFRGARNPVSSTRKLKFINVFIDIGKSTDIAVSQLYFDVMKSLF